MSRVKQNIIILQEKTLEPYDISMCAGNMYMNRLCINEEAGFEFSGVYCLKEAFKKLRNQTIPNKIPNYTIPNYTIPNYDCYYANMNYDSHKPPTGHMVDRSYLRSHSYPSFSNMTTYREINDEIISHYSRFVSFDYHINENDYSQETELTHVPQTDMDQGDMSKGEEVLYGLAKQERQEKGNHFQIAKNIVSHIV